MTTNGDLTFGDDSVSRMSGGDSRERGSVPDLRMPGVDRFRVRLNARRWLERRAYRLWAHFDLSDDKTFEHAVDWLEEQFFGVLEASRDEARAKAESDAAHREYDERRARTDRPFEHGQWISGKWVAGPGRNRRADGRDRQDPRI